MQSSNTPQLPGGDRHRRPAPRPRAVKGSQQLQASLTTWTRAIWAGSTWQAKRDVARSNVMARAGRRVSEALALRSGHGELNPRGGNWLVKAGKRLKARRPPLAVEARATLQANLKVRPKVADEGCS